MLKTLDQNDNIQMDNNAFVVPGTICAIAASSNSSDKAWFIRIKEPYIAETLSEDDYVKAIS